MEETKETDVTILIKYLQGTAVGNEISEALDYLLASPMNRQIMNLAAVGMKQIKY